MNVLEVISMLGRLMWKVLDSALALFYVEHGLMDHGDVNICGMPWSVQHYQTNN